MDRLNWTIKENSYLQKRKSDKKIDMEKGLGSPVIKELQITTARRYHLSPTSLTKSQIRSQPGGLKQEGSWTVAIPAPSLEVEVA